MKDIPGYEGIYALDDQDRVISLPRIVESGFNGRQKRRRAAQVLRPHTNKPYIYQLSKEGKVRRFTLEEIKKLVHG